MSALELDYSDDLSAELSDKRILNRLYELQGLLRGIDNAAQITEEIGRNREELMSDKLRSYYASSKAPGAPSRQGDFLYEVMRAVQERFGLYDPNNPENISDRFDPDMDLRLALTEALQTQLGSGEGFSPAPSSAPLVGPARSATPVFEDPAQQQARGLSSREAVVREVGRIIGTETEQEKKDREKGIINTTNGRGKG